MIIKKYIITFLMLIMFSGCSSVNDHGGATHGFVTWGMKQKFGDGGEKDNYYEVDEMTTIYPGESKDAVKQKLGFPDEIKSNNEGYEIWIYNDKNVRFFFEDGKFREWTYLKQ